MIPLRRCAPCSCPRRRGLCPACRGYPPVRRPLRTARRSCPMPYSCVARLETPASLRALFAIRRVRAVGGCIGCVPPRLRRVSLRGAPRRSIKLCKRHSLSRQAKRTRLLALQSLLAVLLCQRLCAHSLRPRVESWRSSLASKGGTRAKGNTRSASSHRRGATLSAAVCVVWAPLGGREPSASVPRARADACRSTSLDPALLAFMTLSRLCFTAAEPLANVPGALPPASLRAVGAKVCLALRQRRARPCLRAVLFSSVPLRFFLQRWHDA
ncbi:hypothetical protein TRVL_04289 [Trypanosoma vivax]|nr:hypothetical protein TRVL_04289 [Trypanosoma vivax]